MSGLRPIGKLLLTGVPGWLTEALLDDLARSPRNGLSAVRCLVQRNPEFDDRSFVARHALDLEIVSGDLRDAESLRTAVQGVDTVLHAAGILHVRRTREWYDINTDGTEALARTAAATGVQRFVFVSSNAAAGRAPSMNRLMTELDPPRPLSHYGRSKLLAEQKLVALSSRLETVVIRPCMFYGPPVPKRHLEIYRRILYGRMPLVGGGQYARSLTHVDNLMQGCELAMTHPRAVGQTYYIADRAAYTTRQVVDSMAEALGTSPRYLRLPALIGTLAYHVDSFLSLMGRYWQTVHLVGESNWHVGVSCEKACRELGYEPRMALREGMRQAIDWCVSRGLLHRTLDRYQNSGASQHRC